jgi:hypothetical protein
MKIDSEFQAKSFLLIPSRYRLDGDLISRREIVSAIKSQFVPDIDEEFKKK